MELFKKKSEPCLLCKFFRRKKEFQNFDSRFRWCVVKTRAQDIYTQNKTKMEASSLMNNSFHFLMSLPFIELAKLKIDQTFFITMISSDVWAVVV